MSIRTRKGRALYLGLTSSMLIGCTFQPPFNGFKADKRLIGPSSISSQTRESAVISLLQKEGIEFVKYGDLRTLIVPTDRYFVFNTPHLNELAYKGLNDIILLIKTYSHGTIYVAAFSDNVGTRAHKDKLTQARAEAMLTFLWANQIPAEQLRAEGYGDQFDIGNNQLTHSSAFNRRIEIQWSLKKACDTPMNAAMTTK